MCEHKRTCMGITSIDTRYICLDCGAVAKIIRNPLRRGTWTYDIKKMMDDSISHKS